jgi:hypothetical protein
MQGVLKRNGYAALSLNLFPPNIRLSLIINLSCAFDQKTLVCTAPPDIISSVIIRGQLDEV